MTASEKECKSRLLKKIKHQDSEPIIIDLTGRYFAYTKIRFYLRTIEIDESLGRMSFNKVGLNRILHSKETLRFWCNGVEKDRTVIDYNRPKNV